MATVDAAYVANPPAYMVAAIGEPSYLDSPSAMRLYGGLVSCG